MGGARAMPLVCKQQPSLTQAIRTRLDSIEEAARQPTATPARLPLKWTTPSSTESTSTSSSSAPARPSSQSSTTVSWWLPMSTKCFRIIRLTAATAHHTTISNQSEKASQMRTPSQSTTCNPPSSATRTTTQKWTCISNYDYNNERAQYSWPHFFSK